MNGLYGTSVTGMQGAAFVLNVVANNIANLNTDGFQSIDPVLASLPSQGGLMSTTANAAPPVATNEGMGVASASTTRSQVPASLVHTEDPADLAISGSGVFALRQTDGTIVYSSQLSLQVRPDGQLVTSQGLSVMPPVRVPANVVSVTADASGKLVALGPEGQAVYGKDGKPLNLGTLKTVTFSAPENLTALGSGLYSESLSSGRPQVPQAGSLTVSSGYQLNSTVDLTTQMVEMIQAQRMFEANGKALQTIDSLINNVVNIQAR